MRFSELLRESVQPAPLEEIIKAMQPMAAQKIIWRGMTGGTVYQKVTNNRSGFYGGIKDEAAAVIRALGIKNPAFASLSPMKTMQFGSLNVMIPIQPFRALQSEELADVVYTYAGSAEDVAATYKERMDFEDSEIIFDIAEYYLIGIEHAIKMIVDPDDFDHRSRQYAVKKARELKTYQDVIDILTKD